MGWGDELVASGLARGAHEKGRRIAFGFGGQIRWTPQAHEIFRNNPNVAPPGSEGAPDLQWIAHCAGSRLNTSGIVDRSRWRWLPFKPPPGEVFFDDEELEFGSSHGGGFVVIEPRVKPQWPNKQWPQDRYRAIAMKLAKRGLRVVQFSGMGRPIDNCGQVIFTPTFRKALAVLAHAALYIGAEGGLHHGAAAVGTKAVVIFGGWPDPQSSGYESHRNLAAIDAGCGTIKPCHHCRAAMERITVAHVLDAAMAELGMAEQVA
jgi:ADP-heptose:LPS heptosyltransferase